MNQTENVKTQYEDDKNLTVRAGLHAKHSTNPKGFAAWLFEQYRFAENDSILELGCGNAGQWAGEIEKLPSGCRLLLSDFSKGMVAAAKAKHALYKYVSFAQIDIQNIPAGEEGFDVVIANHMLYHVPNLDLALSEVSRVLRPGGLFYCATNGNGGMRAFLRGVLQKHGLDARAFEKDVSFSLQNGANALKRHFFAVERVDYDDALAVTETRDLIDWLVSALSVTGYAEENMRGLYDYFEKIRLRDGAIHIPKECGMFICKKAPAANS